MYILKVTKLENTLQFFQKAVFSSIITCLWKHKKSVGPNNDVRESLEKIEIYFGTNSCFFLSHGSHFNSGSTSVDVTLTKHFASNSKGKAICAVLDRP